MPAVIEVDRVSKCYPRGVQALRDVTFSVERGEFVFLTGPSGSGKSTLLRMLTCQETPSSGRLLVDQRDLSALSRSDVQAHRRHVGFVFQDFKLIPRRTVLENVSLVPRVLGQSEFNVRRRALQALTEVGLHHRVHAFPDELSGGEQQRVAIARALVNEPTVLLADEPTGNLDPDLALEIMGLFRQSNTRGTTVVVATHDPSLIRYVGRRTLVLDNGRVSEAN